MISFDKIYHKIHNKKYNDIHLFYMFFHKVKDENYYILVQYMFPNEHLANIYMHENIQFQSLNILHESDHIIELISYQFLYEFLINIALSPFVFKFLDLFKNKLSIKDVKDLVDNV